LLESEKDDVELLEKERLVGLSLSSPFSRCLRLTRQPDFFFAECRASLHGEEVLDSAGEDRELKDGDEGMDETSFEVRSVLSV
jgi:hypothetical protein